MTDTPFPDWSTKRAGTPAAFRKTMRKNWYVRSAQMTGIVPHPSAKLGAPRLAAGCVQLGDCCTPVVEASTASGCPRTLGKDVVLMKVRLPDSIPVRVLVNAKNRKAAEARLRAVLPGASVLF